MFVNYLVLLSFAVNKYRTQTSHYVRNKLKKAILLGFNTRCCISHHIDSILVVLVLNKMLFFANIWHQTWKAHCQVDCEYLIVFTQGPTGQSKGSWSFRKSPVIDCNLLRHAYWILNARTNKSETKYVKTFYCVN